MPQKTSGSGAEPHRGPSSTPPPRAPAAVPFRYPLRKRRNAYQNADTSPGQSTADTASRYKWYAQEVRPRMQGHSMLIRYADDFVAGFEMESDARRFLAVLEKRLERFHLKLHPEKTQLLDFSRGSEATFTFLGFCHYWARSQRGHWVVK